ncbi:unnamed protein product [Acanthoscelides obtectus]|uniref:Uncharacterized protein n=1 Tax=Acanthoscelides obtectus TaxID=200917 RepID=A0A9P0K1K0_ACAOB|nr:unnamed protein product [Acanthoscelides obtectus]CAK1657033.1 hypothetical protein AOBTE_LOCUS20074 [Acanthoscelides obtectus]
MCSQSVELELLSSTHAVLYKLAQWCLIINGRVSRTLGQTKVWQQQYKTLDTGYFPQKGSSTIPRSFNNTSETIKF